MNLSVISGGGAGRLGFVDLALKAFAFLLRLGFVVTRRDGTLVRFERDNVFVNVYHGRSSYQVCLELGRVPQNDIYWLHELLSATAPAHIDQARWQTADPEVLGRCLSSIGATIEQCCGPLLNGDTDAFEKLRAAAAPGRRAATLQAQFGAIIDRADKAWESKDLSKAAALYEKSEPGLDATRVRRLEYLRKRERK